MNCRIEDLRFILRRNTSVRRLRNKSDRLESDELPTRYAPLTLVLTGLEGRSSQNLAQKTRCGRVLTRDVHSNLQNQIRKA